MIRIAIVEDEESYISVLKEYLERYKKESGEQIEVIRISIVMRSRRFTGRSLILS